MKRFRFFVVFILFFLVIPLSVYSQSSSLFGVIKDSANNDPLIGAFVIIDGTSLGVATDIDGNYSINNIPAGKYVLKISYIGYDDKVLNVEFNKSEKKELNVKLSYSGVVLGAVKVTAQAKGQISAINNQLNSKSIKNVISAERMQELPDANAAETISRLPGVSVQRVGGEGNKVVVRGLSPKYTKVMIEGVSLASSGADRSSDISIVSPYSLDGIELMKAVTADKDADFIGGSINFKLRSADPGLKVKIIAQGGYNGIKSTYSDYMVVGSVSNRFLKNKLGVYLQGNSENRNRSSNEQSAGYIVRELPKIYEVHTDNLKLSDVIRYVNRTGATVVLDYKLKDGAIQFKNFYSNGNTKINRYHESFDLRSSNRLHSYETRKEEYDVKSFSSFLNYEQSFGSFSINAMLSNSSSNRDVPTNFDFQFEQPNAIKSEVLNKVLAPYELINYTNINDSINYLQNIYESSSNTIEIQNSASIDLKYDFAISKKINGNIKIGGKYRFKDRSFDKTVNTGRFGLNSGQGAKDAILRAYPEMQDIAPIGSINLPFILFRNTDFDHKNFLNGEYHMGDVADVDLMTNVLEIVKENVLKDEWQTYGNNAYYSKREDYSGNEYLKAAYVMSEINLGTKIKFIPGVRFESNKTVYTAPRGDATKTTFKELEYAHVDTAVTRENSFLLPMIHMKYSPFEWFNARLAYTQTLSRPSYYQFTPRVDVLQSVVIFNNSKLKPEFSENWDLYLTFHSNKLGLFTIGGFTKKIKNMIFGLNRRVILEPSKYELPDEVWKRDIYTQANNIHDAFVKGVELDWQTNFWYLPRVLKGLVLNINYTHIYSEAKYPRTVVEKKTDPVTFETTYRNIDSYIVGQLVQQPDDIFNIQLGYDYKGFSARISTLYQSRIFKGSNFYKELVQYTDSYNRWDISLKQKLPWYKLQIFCNINNLTGAADRDLIAGKPWNSRIQHYGTTVDLGLRIEL